MITRVARQGGYSIVEIAYVLTAISLVVTGAIWGFSKTIRNDQSKATKEEMLAIHETILTYAANNRTPGGNVYFYTSAELFVVNRIPSGRPILPCPDLNGDGFEDRNGSQTESVEIEINYSFDDSHPPIVDLSDTRSRCIDTKGNLPWRTLGMTKPSDYWGNHYTYWVDDNFTHSVFGFDQLTRGNFAFKHMAIPLEGGGFAYAVRSDPVDARGGFYGQYGTRSNLPYSRASFPHNGIVIGIERIVGAEIEPALNTPTFTPANLIADGPIVVAGELLGHNILSHLEQVEERVANHPGGTKIPVYEFRGLQTTDAESLNLLDADYSNNVLANGVAFALISHGPNGHGAVKYDINHANGAGFECNDFPSLGITTAADALRDHPLTGEILNALRTLPCGEDALTPACTTTNPYSAGISDANINQYSVCDEVGASKSIFVARQDSEIFDDIVTWMHPDELMQALIERGVLPLELPPVALPPGLEPYDYVANNFL